MGIQFDALKDGDLPGVFFLQAGDLRQIGRIVRLPHTVVLIGGIAVVGQADGRHPLGDSRLYHLLQGVFAVGEGGMGVITAIVHKNDLQFNEVRSWE